MGIEVLSLDNSKQGHDLNGFSHVLFEFESGLFELQVFEREEALKVWEEMPARDRAKIAHIYACKMIV